MLIVTGILFSTKNSAKSSSSRVAFDVILKCGLILYLLNNYLTYFTANLMPFLLSNGSPPKKIT